MKQQQETDGLETGERQRLLAEIEETRQDLADALQALAARTNVPARVREKTARIQAAGKRPMLYAVAGVCAAAGLFVLRKKRS
jgi:hypothetical protein